MSHRANFGETWKFHKMKRLRIPCKSGVRCNTCQIQFLLLIEFTTEDSVYNGKFKYEFSLKKIWINTEIRTTLYGTAQIFVLFSMWKYFATIHTLFWGDTLYIHIKQNNWRLKLSVRTKRNNLLSFSKIYQDMTVWFEKKNQLASIIEHVPTFTQWISIKISFHLIFQVFTASNILNMRWIKLFDAANYL